MKLILVTISALALTACQSDYIPDRPSKDRALVTVIDEWVIDPPVVIDQPLDVLPPFDGVDVIVDPPVIGGGPELGGV